MTAEEIEAITGGYHGDALLQRLTALIADVRLSERHLSMRPAQLSGGLKQRVAIARAFAGNPRIVVCEIRPTTLCLSAVPPRYAVTRYCVI